MQHAKLRLAPGRAGCVLLRLASERSLRSSRASDATKSSVCAPTSLVDGSCPSIS
jgi:hypothetical protein